MKRSLLPSPEEIAKSLRADPRKTVKYSPQKIADYFAALFLAADEEGERRDAVAESKLEEIAELLDAPKNKEKKFAVFEELYQRYRSFGNRTIEGKIWWNVREGFHCRVMEYAQGF